LGNSDIGVGKRAVLATLFKFPADADAAVWTVEETVEIFATDSEIELHTSSPTLAPLPDGRFLLAWVQKRADTFDTTPSVMARVFSSSDGEPVGQHDIRVNTTTTGDRFGACAAAIGVPGGESTAFVAWTDDSPTASASSDFSVRGRVLQILPEGIVG
jgi:hypothetical protein